MRSLSARGIKLERLPPEYTNLKNLAAIDLSNNLLAVIPTVLFALPNLEELVAIRNKITTISPQISQLKSLRLLNLSENEITVLPPEVGFMKELVSLDISYNRITELTPQLGILDKLKNLRWEGNKIVSPKLAIVALGTDALLRFMRKLLDGNERCYRMKLMLVGQENVGYVTLFISCKHDLFTNIYFRKTSLLRELRKESMLQSPRRAAQPEPPPLSTDGIDISQWPLYISLKRDDAKPTANERYSPRELSTEAVPKPEEMHRKATVANPRMSRDNLVEITLSAWDFAGKFFVNYSLLSYEC